LQAKVEQVVIPVMILERTVAWVQIPEKILILSFFVSFLYFIHITARAIAIAFKELKLP